MKDRILATIQIAREVIEDLERKNHDLDLQKRANNLRIEYNQENILLLNLFLSEHKGKQKIITPEVILKDGRSEISNTRVIKDSSKEA